MHLIYLMTILIRYLMIDDIQIHYLYFDDNANPTLLLSLSNYAEYFVRKTSPNIQRGPLIE